MDEERAENHENGDKRWGLFLHFLRPTTSEYFLPETRQIKQN